MIYINFLFFIFKFQWTINIVCVRDELVKYSLVILPSLITHTRVMLHIILLSTFCPPKFDVALMIDHYWIYDPMVILRATSNLGGQKENKGMMCSITPHTIPECGTITTQHYKYIYIMFGIWLLYNTNTTTVQQPLTWGWAPVCGTHPHVRDCCTVVVLVL
jgi:hypothetical protein